MSWGSGSFGSLTWGGTGPSTVSTDEFQVLLDEVDVTGKIHDPRSFRTQLTLAARSTCQFTLVDRTLTLAVATGKKVFIMRRGDLLFGGTVEKVEVEVPETDNVRFLDVQVSGWEQSCDRFLVAASYENQTLEAIAYDIVNVQTELWKVGFRLGDVANAPKLTKVTFNYRTAFECFRDLSEKTGTMWKVSPYRVVSFLDLLSYVAPFSLGGGQKKYRKAKWSQTRTRYRNESFLRAGKGRTGVIPGDTGIHDRFTGKLTTAPPEKRDRTFTLRYPIARGAPWYSDVTGQTSQTRSQSFRHPILIKRAGIIQRLGINGKDPDGDLTKPSPSTWPQWFYKFGEQEIVQNSAEDEALNPTLKPGENLDVTYVGQYDLVINNQNKAEIDATILAEGGSGLYQATDEDHDLDGDMAAMEKSDRLMAIYGRRPRQLVFETDVHGLAPGQLINVDDAALGISNVQFLVDSVTFEVLPGDLYRYTVVALDGERQEGWADFFRRFSKARLLTIGENEVVQAARRVEERVTILDTVLVESGDTALGYENDPYSYAIVGKVTVDGQDIWGAIVGRSRVGVPRGA